MNEKKNEWITVIETQKFVLFFESKTMMALVLYEANLVVP